MANTTPTAGGGNGTHQQQSYYGSGGGSSEVSPQQQRFADDTVGGGYTSDRVIGGHGAGGYMMDDEDEPPRGSFGFPKDFWRDDGYVYPATRPGFHVPTHPLFSYPHALMAVPRCRLQSTRTWNRAGLAGQQRCHPQPAQLQPQGSQQRPLQQACLPQQRVQFAGDMDGGTDVVEFGGYVDGGTDVVEIEAEVSSGSTDAEGSLLVLEEHMDGPALEVELPVGELVERGPLPVLDPDGPAFEVELPICLLYTSPSPRDKRQSRMPSSA